MGWKTGWVRLKHQPAHIRTRTGGWLGWIRLGTHKHELGTNQAGPCYHTRWQMQRWGGPCQTGLQHPPAYVRPGRAWYEASRGCWTTIPTGEHKSWDQGRSWAAGWTLRQHQLASVGTGSESYQARCVESPGEYKTQDLEKTPKGKRLQFPLVSMRTEAGSGTS